MKKLLWKMLAVLFQTLGAKNKKEDDTAALHHPSQSSARKKGRKNRGKK